MIYSLRGKLIHTDMNSIVVECGGVGYFCRASLNTIGKMPEIGKEVFVYTYLAVREDAVDLYAFSDKDEMHCFKLVTSVNGVGPKVGISILSEFSPKKLAFFISTGDSKSITAASGVGGKTAQRIVLELKDKLGTGDLSTGDMQSFSPAAGSNTADAVAALISIGYSQNDAAKAVSALDPSLPADTLIKQALKALM